MEYFTRELCEILLDMTALAICMLIVLFITAGSLKNRQKLFGNRPRKQIADFNETVLAQVIKQQFDKSLADTVEVINNRKLLNNKAVRSQEFYSSNQPEPGNPERIDKHDEAARLASAGLNAYAIGDRIKLPQGEIELIVNLHRLRNESAREANFAYAQEAG